MLELDDRILKELDLVVSADTERGIPAWRVNLGYQRMHQVQGPTDLAAAVTQARVGELGQEYRSTTASDAGVLTQYPLAPEITRNTVLTNASDASTEAARLLAIYKVRRHFYNAKASIDDVPALDLGQVVNVTNARFGLAGGKLMRVMGLQPDGASKSITINLWG